MVSEAMLPMLPTIVVAGTVAAVVVEDLVSSKTTTDVSTMVVERGIHDYCA